MAEVKDNSSIQLFEDQKIRTAWDAQKEEWYFAIVVVIAVLTDSADLQNYWRVLKKRLKDEGNEGAVALANIFCWAAALLSAQNGIEISYGSDAIL